MKKAAFIFYNPHDDFTNLTAVGCILLTTVQLVGMSLRTDSF